MSIRETKITFTARDGTALGGIWIGDERAKAGLLISSATAVRADFYVNFAKGAAARGFGCLVYDCRGVGMSRPKHLRGYQASMADWGQLDAPAALDELIDRVGDVPIFTLGHSVGGHLIGFMDNHAKITANAFVAVGSGYWGGHWPRHWPLEFLFFHLVGPWNLLRYGYLQHGGMWQGTDLPAGVYTQWRKWCLNRNYLLDDLRAGRLGTHYFDEVRSPICSFGFTDDAVVNIKTLPQSLGWYSRAPSKTIWVAPTSIGVEKIGHLGAFSRKSSGFWDLPLNWFEGLLD